MTKLKFTTKHLILLLQVTINFDLNLNQIDLEIRQICNHIRKIATHFQELVFNNVQVQICFKDERI
jgi:hypothetical protein